MDNSKNEKQQVSPKENEEQQVSPKENEEDTVLNSSNEKLINILQVSIPQDPNQIIGSQQDQTNDKMSGEQANKYKEKLNQNETQNQNQVPISNLEIKINVQQQDEGMQSNPSTQQQKQEDLKQNEKEVKPDQKTNQKSSPQNQKTDLKQEAQIETQAYLQTQQNEENIEAQGQQNLDQQLKLQKNQSSVIQAQIFKGYEKAILLKAEAHKEAKRVKDLSNLPSDQYLNFVCECCHFPLGGQPYELCCDNSQLMSLGSGFPLYFGYIKYQIVLMIMSFAFGLPMFIACMIKGGDLNKNNDDNSDGTADISFPRMSSVASY